ncbi:WD repeat-containing protein 34-like isoform X2 [Stegodyphus dumicola]|uniref:WD repeat-containing protein 34-like isoform X2 n=1 Tax=Stegodyphus dumicola TaxID=202533 RepID=UPI0015AC19C3|nr:WD repeat-containing protein 34-like isoform X2 [Stegodyphus dumicola]
MFSISIRDSTGFATGETKEKSVKPNFAQTEILQNDEKNCQVPQRESVQVQTDTKEKKGDIFVEFDFCCNFVSWNSVGTAVAAAYGSRSHKSWCDHDSSVGVWSLNRKDFDSKKPNAILETDCCITHVTFHPDLPAILLAGKFNGEIVLWNISKEDDPLLGSSQNALGSHREPITGLFWIHSFKAQDSLEFVSCSLDGKILLWKLENGELVPYDGFIILIEQLPRSFSVKTSKENSEVGVTSLSINCEDQSIFIIGIEGGGIFQCSFNSLVPASYSGYSSVSLKNPITMSFEPHKGQVTSVHFSPFSRNIFLSAGSDGELRIYNLLKPKPLVTFQIPNGSITAAQWSPVRPSVLSCICNCGKLHIWDVTANEKLLTESFTLTSSQSGGLSLQHNKENTNLLATSFTNGQIQVWELPGTVLKTGIEEMKKLQALAKNID